MSKITFQCDCGRTINVAAQHAGKKAKCPQCGKEVIIPVLLIEEQGEIGLALDPFAETVSMPTKKPAAPAPQPVRATPVAPVRAVPAATPVESAPLQAQPVKAQPVQAQPAQAQPARPAPRPVASKAQTPAPASPGIQKPTSAAAPVTSKAQKPAPATSDIALPPLIESAQANAPSAWDLADEPLPELTAENLLPPIMPLASAPLATTIEPLPPLSSLAEEASQASSSPYSHYSPPQTIVRSSGGGDGAWKDYMWIPCSIVLCTILTVIIQSSSNSFGRSGFGSARTPAFGTSGGFSSSTPSPSFSSPRQRTFNSGTGQSGTTQPAPFRNPVKNSAPVDENTNVARLAVEKNWTRKPEVRAIVERYSEVDPLMKNKINREFGGSAASHWDKAPLEKVVMIYREMECLTELALLVKSKDDLEPLQKAIDHAKTFDFHSRSHRVDHDLQEFSDKVTKNPLYAKFVKENIAPKIKEAQAKYQEIYSQIEKDYSGDATALIAVLPYQLKNDSTLALIDDVIKNIPEEIGTKQVLGVVPKTVNEAAKLIEKKEDIERNAFWDKRSMEWDMHDAVKMFEHCYANAMYVDAENFNQQVFWAPGLKQPAMFLRIGMQLVDKSGAGPVIASPPGGTRYPPISHDLSEWELDKNMDHMREVAGKIPEQIGQFIFDRQRRGSCGEWGRNLKDKGFFATPGLFVLRRATNEDESADMAQRLRLDNLVQLLITQKRDARGRIVSGEMQFRLIDVRTKKELYAQPKPMSSVAITGPKGGELIRKELGDLFAYVDTNLLLQDITPKLEALKKVKAEHPEIITKRIQKLVDEKDPYEPLALLIEARYYLENEIATKEELSPIFEKVLGRIKGKQFINADLGTRHDIMKAYVKDPF